MISTSRKGDKNLRNIWADWLNQWNWELFVALAFRHEENNLGYSHGGWEEASEAGGGEVGTLEGRILTFNKAGQVLLVGLLDQP